MGSERTRLPPGRGVGGIRDLKRADQLYEKLADENLRVAHLWLAKAREEGLVGGKI